MRLAGFAIVAVADAPMVDKGLLLPDPMAMI